MVVLPVLFQGQELPPEPALMLVPKVIKSPLLTVAATFFDSVTCVLLVPETVVPAEMAVGVVVSWTVRPLTAEVITPLGNVSLLFPDLVCAFVGVPASDTTAHGDPVLKAVFAVMVARDSVLVLVAALVVLASPE